MYLETRVLIDKDIERAFQIVQDVLDWPEFLPTHKRMKVISQERDKILIEWGLVKLRTSIIIERENKKIITEQTKGLVKGLIAEYIFKEKEGKTIFSLIHRFHSNLPIIGGLIEAFVFLFLKKMAKTTLNSFKERIEKW